MDYKKDFDLDLINFLLTTQGDGEMDACPRMSNKANGPHKNRKKDCSKDTNINRTLNNHTFVTKKITEREIPFIFPLFSVCRITIHLYSKIMLFSGAKPMHALSMFSSIALCFESAFTTGVPGGTCFLSNNFHLLLVFYSINPHSYQRRILYSINPIVVSVRWASTKCY